MSDYLARLEITQQPEKTFYKDEGGQRWYYLYVFFVVVGPRTEELKRSFDHAANGRHKIPIECKLLYDISMDEVEDQSMLQLLGSSRGDPEVSDGIPQLDPASGLGSIRYRINKVSMRKDNQGFRLRISLRGLDHVIQAVVTEPTQVFSKRRQIRKMDRVPEQTARNQIEDCARKRNVEVEKKFARTSMSTNIVLQILSDETLPKVPEFPDLRSLPQEAPRPGTIKPKRTHAYEELEHAHPMAVFAQRIAVLENQVKELEKIVHGSFPSYVPNKMSSSSGQNAHEQNQSYNPLLQETLSTILRNISTNSKPGEQKDNHNTVAAINAAAQSVMDDEGSPKKKKTRKKRY
mmetsp:Transcript_7751/g.12526  ORF Transcript_7751/g.12526 Transcript_7751/m.12526 type:complete len:348 (-) Transcript_7751:41-1084(-)